MTDQSSPAQAIVYNPFSAAVRENPYPSYAALRREAPVCRVESLGAYAVARYADVLHVLKHPELFSSSVMARADATLLGADPPAHTRVRRIVSPAFSPKRLAALEPRVREIADRLIARVAPWGACELMADLAGPLPSLVMAELLGVDPSRHDDFKRWSDAIVLGATGRPSAEQRREVLRSAAEFRAFFERAIAQRRRPASAPGPAGDDLISALVGRDASSPEESLAAEEILSLSMLLLIAGNETTTNLVGNAVAALLRHPPELEKVLADPSLIPAALEETLRYDSPVQLLQRQATQAVELSGVVVPAGALVLPLLGSANRDEAQFPDPDRFDVARYPQGHLAFGTGIHFCLGAGLARFEARVALEAVLLRLRNPRPVAEPLAHVDSMQLRGLQRLDLVFDPA